MKPKLHPNWAQQPQKELPRGPESTPKGSREVPKDTPNGVKIASGDPPGAPHWKSHLFDTLFTPLWAPKSHKFSWNLVFYGVFYIKSKKTPYFTVYFHCFSCENYMLILYKTSCFTVFSLGDFMKFQFRKHRILRCFRLIFVYFLYIFNVIKPRILRVFLHNTFKKRRKLKNREKHRGGTCLSKWTGSAIYF